MALACRLVVGGYNKKKIVDTCEKQWVNKLRDTHRYTICKMGKWKKQQQKK